VTEIPYRSGEDVTLEYVGLAYRFSARDFAERVVAAARRLEILARGRVARGVRADLVELALEGTLEHPRSETGRSLLTAAAPLDTVAYWLRKLVFRSAWIDQRVRAGLIRPEFDEHRGDFRYRFDGHDLPASIADDVPRLGTASRT
jgi:hypothetical protein